MNNVADTKLHHDKNIRWDVLRSRIRGTLSLPNDPGYADAAPWLLSASVFEPAGVVSAATVEDVSLAVLWAGDNGFRVAVQCTGHHATHFGDDVLLIDTRAMNDLHINPQTAVATFGPGCLWSQILQAAGGLGLVPVCGSAPGIGAVGFLVGGGLGPMSRTLGVGSDRVRALTVVTGDGEVRQASPTENADLFWGLRGGKATLGIVVGVALELVPMTTFLGGALYFAGDDIVAVTRVWARWAAELPDQGNTSIAFMQLPVDAPAPAPIVGRMILAVRFAWLGDAEAGRTIFDTISAAGNPVLGSVDEMPAANLGAIHSDPVDPKPFRDEGFLLGEFPPEAVEALLATAGPDSASGVAYVEVRRLGGRVAREPLVPDAFDGRIGQWSLWMGGVPAPGVRGPLPEFVGLLDTMRTWSANRSLPNFLITDDPTQMSRLWSTDTYCRLQILAERYDPNRIFDVGQVVPRPARSESGVVGDTCERTA